MSDDLRKKIIIDEINYWKKHNLLPEEHCNFLLALYTQGAEQPNKSTNKLHPIFTILLILLTPLSLIVIYFTELPFLLQVVLILTFIAFSLWNYINFKNYDYHFTFIALITVLILVLMLSVFTVNFLFNASYILILIILGNFIYWYILGKRLKLRLLTNISIIALVFAFIYIIYKFI